MQISPKRRPCTKFKQERIRTLCTLDTNDVNLDDWDFMRRSRLIYTHKSKSKASKNDRKTTKKHNLSQLSQLYSHNKSQHDTETPKNLFKKGVSIN
jgi:hypothetical protein